MANLGNRAFLHTMQGDDVLNKWRENRIHPVLAKRVRRKLEVERGAPDTLGQQFRSGRTQTVGVLLPPLDQPHFLHLLAGIEGRLGESDYMALPGVAHWQQPRQVELAERMLARRADAPVLPSDILLAGFDEPMESWTTETVRHVVREPLLVVRQATTEMGRVVVEMALAAIDGSETRGQQRLIRPAMSWQETQ